MGRPRSALKLMKVDIWTGKILKLYKSYWMAACEVDGEEAGISKCIRGVHSSYKGYLFVRDDIGKEELEERINKARAVSTRRQVAVAKYDLEGKLVKKYSSIIEAEKENYMGSGYLHAVIRKYKGVFNGYKYEKVK